MLMAASGLGLVNSCPSGALPAGSDGELVDAADNPPLVAVEVSTEDRNHACVAQHGQDRVARLDRFVYEDESRLVARLCQGGPSERHRGSVSLDAERDDLDRPVGCDVPTGGPR